MIYHIIYFLSYFCVRQSLAAMRIIYLQKRLSPLFIQRICQQTLSRYRCRACAYGGSLSSACQVSDTVLPEPEPITRVELASEKHLIPMHGN